MCKITKALTKIGNEKTEGGLPLFMDLNDNVTQAQLGKAIGISERSVRSFLKKNSINHKEHSLGELISIYIERLRESAAGRESGNINLSHEKALMLRIKRKIAEKELKAIEREEEMLKGFIKDADDDRIELSEFLMLETKTQMTMIRFMIDGGDKTEVEDKLIESMLKVDKTINNFMDEFAHKKRNITGNITDYERRRNERL